MGKLWPFLLAFSLLAQDTLDNRRIAELVRAGVRPSEIASIIRASHDTHFDLTMAGLESLVNAGVPDEVIKAMGASLNGGAPPTASAPAPRPPNVDPFKRTSGAAQTNSGCIQFTVVFRDKLNNIKQGLSAEDVKWFEKTVGRRYPGVCYVDPAPSVAVVFYISVTPATYHGARVVTSRETHEGPISGTVTDQDGGTSQLSGEVETTTTSSTAVPYSFEYGVFTLSVERRQDDGRFQVAHRFQQKGLYHTLYGIPLGGRGHHPVHAVIEDAAKWANAGGLTDSRQGFASR
jgi:hypothetical protein